VRPGEQGEDMASIYGVLQVGKQALVTQQEALNVTAHNISNVNTPGYSRQRVMMETAAAITTSAGQVGTGVTVSGIERVYDRYLTDQISNENETLGRWEAEKGGLERVEVVFDEASGYGLNQSMGEFWNAWQDLANNPSGQTERQMLLGAAEALTANFQRVYNDLTGIQAELDGNISQTVSDINVKAGQIAEINQKIVQIESRGGTANDYRDERDMLVKELAGMIDITAFEQSNGSVNISLGDGNMLVEDFTSKDLSTNTNASGFCDVVWGETGASINISGGKLKGWLEVRDVTIPEYKDDLDTLVNGIMGEVNPLHANGYGLDGSTGNDFFTGSLAGGDFGVAAAVSADVNAIAASGTAAGVPGDNSNAIAIANLQYSLTMSSGTATFDDFYNAIVSGVGFDVQTATSSYDHQDSMVSYLENYRESVSGVSLDEEMINMLQFESAYEAAAKLISTVDEMLQTLMSIA
jgi:flagellar hook-associated protein 1 FlgK